MKKHRGRLSFVETMEQEKIFVKLHLSKKHAFLLDMLAKRHDSKEKAVQELLEWAFDYYLLNDLSK
jgi:hypothetical protein